MQATRREIIVGLAALPLLGAGVANRNRVVLLGTKGGPTPGVQRAAPATLIEVDGKAWVVDCGNGVASQLTKAGTALDQLQHIFITHNHSDHIADIGTLIETAWSSGLTTGVTVHGPPPVKQILHDQLAAFAYDVAARIREEGRIPLAPLVSVDERAEPGLVLREHGVTVTSALVDHQTIKPSFGYRFDTLGRSIVISGDTRYSQNLVALAKGVDLLIHEAIYGPWIDQTSGENAPLLRDHLRKSHTVAEEVGLVAARAGVKKLVLSHLVPGGPQVTDAMWLAAVRTNFSGDVVIGHDLMEV
jgi:ribonuclease BN (tRNA processing enzyme)